MGTNNNEILNELAKDISCLDPIYKELSDINCFEILKIDQMEIRHSNFLAWLLDPSSPSGIGDKLLKRLLMFCSENSDKGFGSNKDLDAVTIELLNLEDVVLKREYPADIKGKAKKKKIDLLIYSEINKFCICLENKIKSYEGTNQLIDYFNYVEEDFTRKKTAKYKKYRYEKRYYILLSPSGNEAEKEEDRNSWVALSYADLFDWIKEILDTYEEEIPVKAKNIINDYLNALQRHVIEGDFKRLCEEVYMKHPRAFAYFENNYKGKDVPEGQETLVGYKLYNKHRKAIDLVLDNKTKLTEKVKAQLIEALRERGCKVQYDPKRAPVYIKVPEKLTNDTRLVDQSQDNIGKDFLFYELYYAPGEKCFFVNLRCQLHNCPVGFDTAVYGKELGKKGLLVSKKISKASTSAYINALEKNPREPSKDEDFIKELCNEVANTMYTANARKACQEVIDAIQ